MIKNITELLGLKNEVENEYKKMLDFPKTLLAIDSISLVILIINRLVDFITFNSRINLFVFMLIGVIFIVAGGLWIKIRIDFKKSRQDFDERFWQEYGKIYEEIEQAHKIEDIDVNINDNQISRKLDFKCKEQEITEKMIESFMTNVLHNKDEDIEISDKYPMENWDFYQIFGLKNAYISNDKATLTMKEKLPSPTEQTESNLQKISMYLNAFSTLKKENQVLYKKDVERKIIDVEKQ